MLPQQSMQKSQVHEKCPVQLLLPKLHDGIMWASVETLITSFNEKNLFLNRFEKKRRFNELFQLLYKQIQKAVIHFITSMTCVIPWKIRDGRPSAIPGCQNVNELSHFDDDEKRCKEGSYCYFYK